MYQIGDTITHLNQFSPKTPQQRAINPVGDSVIRNRNNTASNILVVLSLCVEGEDGEDWITLTLG